MHKEGRAMMLVVEDVGHSLVTELERYEGLLLDGSH